MLRIYKRVALITGTYTKISSIGWAVVDVTRAHQAGDDFAAVRRVKPKSTGVCPRFSPNYVRLRHINVRVL